MYKLKKTQKEKCLGQVQVNIGKNSLRFRKEVKKILKKYEFWALISSHLPCEILKNGDTSPRSAWLLNSNSLTAKAATVEHVEKGEEQQAEVFSAPWLLTLCYLKEVSVRVPFHKFGRVILLYLPKQL